MVVEIYYVLGRVCVVKNLLLWRCFNCDLFLGGVVFVCYILGFICFFFECGFDFFDCFILFNIYNFFFLMGFGFLVIIRLGIVFGDFVLVGVVVVGVIWFY